MHQSKAGLVRNHLKHCRDSCRGANAIGISHGNLKAS